MTKAKSDRLPVESGRQGLSGCSGTGTLAI